ncbi:hypothetical protein [Paraburkholderia sp. SIMBA_054]|uniref:hypothetical protein n=1 Tax=Paraburkholderia sp. SIMBA_054 TaxID=3085795 RepID=UPI00397DE21F
MNNNLVTIVALSVDTRHAVLYMQDGSTHMIAQGDARLPKIVEQSKHKLANNEPALVDITPIFVQRTEFADAEKGTKGVVKFLRVAKSFLKSLVNTESPEKVDEAVAHISPLTIGVFPGQPAGAKEEDEPQHPATNDADLKVAAPAVADAAPVAAEQNATTCQAQAVLTNDQKLDAARTRMQQLVGNSVGTADPAFHAPLDEEKETIVAVHETSGAIIPDAHKLARQLRSAQKLQDYAGFQKFIERLSAIIDDRGHSVEDLMKFIEKGDLPIADDGSIVIYKRLNSRGKDTFADCHTGNVRQKVGSYVFMKPGLVDPSRRKDCSNGLHVATLGYIRNFSGDVTVIAKVRPEDVFAVPEYDLTKMRVCGYHVLVNLPEKLRTLVNSGGSLSSDPDGARILNDVLRGNHIGIIQHVEIGGHRGTNITYTDVDVKSADQLPAPILGKAETLDMQEVLEAKAPVAPVVKARELVADTAVINKVMSNSTEKTEEGDSKPKKPNQVGKAALLHEAMTRAMTWPQEVAAARELLAFKKQARKSWAALGLPDDIGEQVDKLLNAGAPAPKSKPVKAAGKSVKKTAKPVQNRDKPVTPQKQDGGKTTLSMVELAIEQLKEGLPSVQVAENTGLSKDQIYRIKKKLTP